MRITKGLVIAAIFGLLACSRGAPEKKYYQLPTSDTPASQANTIVEKQSFIWIDALNLADFLKDQGIAYQVSDVAYVNAGQHLWLVPLEMQLSTQLIKQLSEALPSQLISTKRMTHPTMNVSLKMDGFHGRYDGSVIVAGEWIVHLVSEDKFITKPFKYHVDLPDDGYEELVKTLAETWQAEVADLAELLRQKLSS